MPLPRKFARPVPDPQKDQILVSLHGLAKLCKTHDETVLRALANSQIQATAWADLNGALTPLFSPATAIVFVGIRPPILPNNNPPPVIC